VSISTYLNELRAALRLGPLIRRRIMNEVEDHLREAAARERRAGATPEDAEERAVERFGAATEIAAAFLEVDGARATVGGFTVLWLSVSAASVVALLTSLYAPTAGSLATAPAPTGLVVETSPGGQFAQMRVEAQADDPEEGDDEAAPLVRATASVTVGRSSVAIRHARPQRHPAIAEPTTLVALSRLEPPRPDPLTPEREDPSDPMLASRAPADSDSDQDAPLLPPPAPPLVARQPSAPPPPSLAAPPQPVGRSSHAEVKYPPEARWAEAEGDVYLILHVDADGRVQNVTVAKRLGHGLDQVAQDLGYRLRFKPARDARGRSVEAFVNWKIHFTRGQKNVGLPGLPFRDQDMWSPIFPRRREI